MHSYILFILTLQVHSLTMGDEYRSTIHQIIHSKQERLEFCDCYYSFRIVQQLKRAQNFRQMLLMLGKSKVKNS